MMSRKNWHGLLVWLIVSLFWGSFTVLADAELEKESYLKHRLIGLIDYMMTDYDEAVVPQGGAIKDEQEYKEMQNFVETTERMFRELLKKPNCPQKECNEILDKIVLLKEAVERKVPPQAIASHCLVLKKNFLNVFDLEISPQKKPSYAIGKVIYANHCASCHGAQGLGDGPAGMHLDPKPRNFQHADFIEGSSPFKIYNTLLTGIEGTPMVSYASLLTEDELWSVGFYVMGLRFTPGALQTREYVAKSEMDLRLLSSKSDHELLDWGKERGAFPEEEKPQILSWLRVSLPYDSDLAIKFLLPKNKKNETSQSKVLNALHFAMKKVQDAQKLYAAGEFEDAENSLLDAYLEGFEEVERSLSLKDKNLSLLVEHEFILARSMAKSSTRDSFVGAIDSLQAHLTTAEMLLTKDDELSAASSWLGDFFGSFLIILREGFEAFLILAALFALVKNLQIARAARWVHAGWISALLCGVMSFWLFEWVLRLSGAAKENIEAFTTALAVITLFYTGFWLLNQSERMQWEKFIKSKSSIAITQGNLWTLFFMAFIAVYREAAETMLFYSALYSTAHTKAAVVWGFVVGSFVLFGLSWGILKFNLRLPLRKFFLSTSILMITLAIILTGKTVHEFIEAGLIAPTQIPIPSVDLLGVYPSLETVGAQLSLLLVTITMVLRKKTKGSNGLRKGFRET